MARGDITRRLARPMAISPRFGMATSSLGNHLSN
jgi:hypothetical protein